MIAEILHGFPLLPVLHAWPFGRERNAKRELVWRWGASPPQAREWIVAALQEAGPQFSGYPQMLEREHRRWAAEHPSQRTPEPQESAAPTREWRDEQLAMVHGADLDIATDALLELAHREPDRGWTERLLLQIIDGDADAQLRALAVTCLGHVARRHRAIDRETVLPVLRELLDDPTLGDRARETIDDIETFASGA
ncbi:hypothetical protein ACQP2P_26100 [Dactylosporangium sp. CA-139114]|uniref:hypothetical protein n=1 Tax=Dactylosporangium sp. CA-139114 TaxID=3239931 RepID=UPI003D983610